MAAAPERPRARPAPGRPPGQPAGAPTRPPLPLPPLQGPLNLITEGYTKHGEVFTVPVFHKRVTFVLGPHASPHFFNATDEKMSQTEVRRRAGGAPAARGGLARRAGGRRGLGLRALHLISAHNLP